MLGKRQEALPEDAVTPQEAIKDPFVLEFLDLKDEYSECDLEAGLIQHLARASHASGVDPGGVW